MHHNGSILPAWSALRTLRTGALLLLSAAWSASAAGCLLVIGEPDERDAAGEGDAAADLGSLDAEAGAELDADAGEQTREDAGGDAGGAAPDAGLALDAEAGAAQDGAADSAAGDVGAGADGGDERADAAAPDAADGSACGAGTMTWYPDDDEDGYGRSGEPREACFRPEGKWSLSGGDCRDNDDRVHPGQTLFFGQPYSLGGGLDSFDYDCVKGEEGDPTQAILDGGCGPLGILLCTDDTKGYAARSDRAGANVNARCGSKRLNACVWQTIALVCASTVQDVEMPYRCR